MKRFLPCLLLGAVLWGCSQEPPAIREKFQQTNYISDTRTGRSYSQLSLFLHVEDEDGYEDLEYLYIINDAEELFWELDSDEWDYRERDGESWIGSNEIVMADFSPFPEGEYRIVLVDQAGERIETEIYLRAFTPPGRLPVVDVSEGFMAVTGLSRDYSVWMYKGDNLLKDRALSAGTTAFSDFAEGMTHFYVYYYDDNAGCGIVLGPFVLG